MSQIVNLYEFIDAYYGNGIVRIEEGVIVDFDRNTSFDTISHFIQKGIYHVKPEVIPIGDHMVPAPITQEPEIGDTYFTVDLRMQNDGAETFEWENDQWDKQSLKLRICHLSKEAAQTHTEALLSFTYEGN